VANPFWAHPADLSGNNYLPYLQTCYRDYSYLRWMLGTRFAYKAKMAYEFESMYNHSAWLYPAMARLFRSLGAQIAPMWQYTLSPVAQFRAGSHYLNAYGTPRKAISFRIASRVFRSTPRYAPFDLAAKEQLLEPGWTASFDENLSLWFDESTFMHSGPIRERPASLPDKPTLIVGYGNSPLVAYEGSGMYTLEFKKDHAMLRITPDVRYLYPTWQRPSGNPPKRVCELDVDSTRLFELHMPGWTKNITIERVEKGQRIPVTRSGQSTRFEARPGSYRLKRDTAEATERLSN
jgi:hypothetical protein